MVETKKYYWLKLKKDFFKRHDIQIIESVENGKDYILFYLKLLVESVDHDGRLRFNDMVPYNERMLSTITNTNIDIVRSAMKVFTELNMIEVLQDQTIYMLEVEKMMGTETYWAEQKRKQRLNSQEDIKVIGQCPTDVQTVSNVSNQEIEIDKEKDINKDINKKKKETDFDVLINEYTDNEELKINIYEFIKMRKGIKAAITTVGLKRLLNKLDTLATNDQEKIKVLDNSIMNSWKSIYADKGSKTQNVKKEKTERGFNNFEAREYDYDSLEKKLLGWEDDPNE